MEEIINQLARAELTEKQLKAIAYLVMEDNKAAVARRIGIDPSTLHRWYAKPTFREAVTAARRTLLTDLFEEVRQQAVAIVRRNPPSPSPR